MKKPLFATFCATLALASTATCHAADPGFTSIFDGKSLDGWEGNPAIWSVKDGAITGTTTAELGLKHNTFLVWKSGTVDDFILHLKYRMQGGNSGIQYRSKVVEQGAQGPIVAGYQADMEAGKTYSGILYEERGRGILANRGQKTVIRSNEGGKFKVEVAGSVGNSDEIQASIKNNGEWNDYVVVAKGNHLVHTINGHTTIDVTDEDAAHAAKSGVLALQVHVGPPMVVQFKDLQVKKLDANSGVGKPVVKDIDAIQGEWVGFSGKRDGEAIPADWLAGLHLKIQGGKYEVVMPNITDAGTLELKSDVLPKQMNITSDGAGSLEGIYKIEDGKLVVAYGENNTAGRPKNFNGDAGSGSLTITYKKK